MAADFATLGVDVETTKDEAFPVWKENWQSVLLFLAMETQWRAVGRFGLPALWTGIDYTAAAAFLGLRSRAEQRRRSAIALLADLRIMENAALPIMNGDD